MTFRTQNTKIYCNYLISRWENNMYEVIASVPFLFLLGVLIARGADKNERELIRRTEDVLGKDEYRY